MSIEEIQENVENLNFSEAGPSNAGTQSRAEKKARQALQGLGLKKVQGVTRVVLRRPRNVMLVASNPEVHTAPGSGIHIVRRRQVKCRSLLTNQRFSVNSRSKTQAKFKQLHN